MKIKLFIDFDGTVFDANTYKVGLFSIFKSAGFDDDEIANTYNAECLDYKYSPAGNLKRLRKIHDFNFENALKRLQKLNKRMPEFIYEDVSEFLSNIDRNKYEINLLTLGDIDFQKEKFENSDLKKYFDSLYFTDIQKWDYLKGIVDKNESFIIIDDRGDTCEMVAKSFKKSMPIEINRTVKPIDDMEGANHFNGIKVKNLKQAIKYL